MAYQSNPLIFRAIADPTRRAILSLLREDGRPVGRIAEDFEVSRPAISQHLRVLRDAGLVRERRDGRQRIYALDPRPLVEVDQWLASYRASWEGALLSLKEYVEGEETASTRAPSSPSGRRSEDRDQRD